MQELWLAHAAAGERLRGQQTDLELGAGKAASAAALAASFAVERPPLLLLYGAGGALPGTAPLRIGELCIVTHDLLADDGRQEAERFVDLGQLGFGPIRFTMHPALSARAAGLLGVRAVGGATVSACSATDAAAHSIAARSGAHVESMEGAAVALVCARYGVPLVQLRAISNLTGDRYTQGADFALAIGRLHEALGRLLAGGWP